MNTFKNYGELEELIVDWVDRQDIKDKISTFVRLITSEVSKDLRIPTMEEKVVLNVYGDGSVNIPNNLLELISLDWLTTEADKVIARTPLNRGSLNKFTKSKESPSYGATPNSFTRILNSFRIYPLPASEETVKDNGVYNDTVIGNVEAYYYSVPFTINENGETNWILQVSPDIYFYGCLMHAYRYIRDIDAAEYWQSKYERSIKELQVSNDIADWAGGPIVVGGSNA